MRSTLTGVLVCGEHAYVAHVGNSRAYLYSAQGNLWQLTKDHSLAFGLVSAGLIGPTALNVLPLAQRLYRSLGDSEHTLQLDTFELCLRPGDRLLLCSDGLWRQVCDPQMEVILRTIGDPRAAVQELQRQARQRGSPDDVSTIIVRMLETDGYGAGPACA
jgi:protein phosphatase